MAEIPLKNGEYTVIAYDVNMSASSLEDCLIANAKFKYISFEGGHFEMARFDAAKLYNVSFENANFDRVSFVNAKIKNGRYAGMTIEGIPVEDLLNAYRTSAEHAVTP
jgi:uncharacterized protein YjbI with pentapeptide repeats